MVVVVVRSLVTGDDLGCLTVLDLGGVFLEVCCVAEVLGEVLGEGLGEVLGEPMPFRGRRLVLPTEREEEAGGEDREDTDADDNFRRGEGDGRECDMEELARGDGRVRALERKERAAEDFVRGVPIELAVRLLRGDARGVPGTARVRDRDLARMFAAVAELERTRDDGVPGEARGDVEVRASTE